MAARLAWVEKMQLKQKCGVALATKRLFDEDQKEFIEGYLAMYGDLGWPLSNKMVAARMTKFLRSMGRVNEYGQPIDVSAKYARKFVKNRPMLKAMKTSNIDPLRSKKATVEVSLFLMHKLRSVTHAPVGQNPVLFALCSARCSVSKKKALPKPPIEPQISKTRSEPTRPRKNMNGRLDLRRSPLRFAPPPPLSARAVSRCATNFST